MKKSRNDHQSSVLHSSSLLSAAAPLALLLGTAGCGLVADAKASPTSEQSAAATAKAGDAKSGPGVLVTGDFQHRARAAGARVVTGKFTFGPTTDIAVLGGAGAAATDKQVWVLQPLLDGSGVFQGQFDLAKIPNQTVANLLANPVMNLDAGDFDNDGDDDIVFIGKSQGNQLLFTLMSSNSGAGFFPTPLTPPSNTFLTLGSAAGARVLACDVNGDHRSDIVVLGGANQSSVAVAFMQNNNVSFLETYVTHADLATWAQDPNAKVACDDFNGDGKEDLVVTGGGGWYTVPVAFASPLGNGSFTVNNYPMSGNPSIPDVSRAPGSQMVTGDFNNDGDADLFFTGSSQWLTAPIGISTGVGTWSSTISQIGDVAYWSREWGSKAKGGDFNGDGRDDVAIVGGADYFFTLPLALSTGATTGDYTFTIMNPAVP